MCRLFLWPISPFIETKETAMLVLIILLVYAVIASGIIGDFLDKHQGL